MAEMESGKITRLLDIYTQLTDGKVVRKHDIVAAYGVSSRSVQRDFEDIRQFLNNQTASDGLEDNLIYICWK